MKRPPNGFTLIELLMSLAIFALISLLIFGGFRFGLRTWEKGADRVDGVSQVGMAQDLLRRELAVATLPRRERESQLEREPVMFLGAHSSVRFVSTLPIRADMGRYYILNVRADPSGDQQALVLIWQSFRPDGSRAEGEQVETDLLMDRIAGVEFSYFGVNDGNRQAGWVREWSDPRSLPQLVRVRVVFPPGDARIWPDLIVAPRLSFRQ